MCNSNDCLAHQMTHVAAYRSLFVPNNGIDGINTWKCQYQRQKNRIHCSPTIGLEIHLLRVSIAKPLYGWSVNPMFPKVNFSIAVRSVESIKSRWRHTCEKPNTFNRQVFVTGVCLQNPPQAVTSRAKFSLFNCLASTVRDEIGS